MVSEMQSSNYHFIVVLRSLPIQLNKVKDTYILPKLTFTLLYFVQPTEVILVVLMFRFSHKLRFQETKVIWTLGEYQRFVFFKTRKNGAKLFLIFLGVWKRP